MRRPLVALSAVPGLVLAVLLSGCTGGDPGPDADDVGAAAAAPAAAADAGAEVAPAAVANADPGEAEGEGRDAEEVDLEDDSAAIDVSVPPEPDPSADAADYGDFGWAFEHGRTEGLYGRTDYYEPRGVSEPGSMAGLRAQQAYRAGFALGLSQAEGRVQQRAVAQESATGEAEADGPVGQVLAGWDAYSAASAYWELADPLSCGEAEPEDPCLDTRYTVGNRSMVAVARLDPTAGPEPRHALELRAHVLGYEVLQVWDATHDEPEATLPAWARDG